MAIAVEESRPKKRSVLDRLSVGNRDKFITTTNLLLMCLPALGMLIVFNYLPMFGLVIAFKDYRFAKGIFGSEWVGLNNFRFIFGGTGTGWRLVWHTVSYNLVFIFSGLIGSLAVAFLINEVHTTRASRVYQALAFLPHFVSWVVVGIFANGFLRYDGGVVNKVLISLGREPMLFYQSPQYWPYIMAAVNLWKGVGFGSIVYMAGMLGIDNELYEAAQIDGANRWQQIRYITLPLLIPLIVTLTLLALGGIFRGNLQMFQMMVGNNPLLYSTTDIIDTFVFRSLLNLGSLGLASAAGFFQSVVGLVMIVATNALVKALDKERALY